MKFASLLAGGLLLTAATASAVNYNGNGASGFGGTVGNGILSVTNGGAALNFVFNASNSTNTGLNGNSLAFYFDTVQGGFGTTQGFIDDSDGGRAALSGYNSGNNNGAGTRTLLTFPTNFTADYGLSLEDGFAGLFRLTTGGQFTFVASGNLVRTGNNYTFSLQRSDLGLNTTQGFNFVGSLISTTAYRANETIGTSTTTIDPSNAGTAPNAGFTGSQIISTANNFAAVPEPGTVACLGLGLAAVAGAGLRRSRCNR